MQDNQQHINQLINSCKEGSQSAQFEIYKLYYKAMFNTALRIVQDRFEAEDVMQEAFLSAYTKLDTFKGEVPFGAWLKRIVINRSLTQVKKKNRLSEVKLEVVEHSLQDEDGVSGLSELDLTDHRVNEVMQGMSELKESYRVVLNLSLIEGYDNEEIAQILEITNQNCRTMISRAKSRLRKVLQASVLD